MSDSPEIDAKKVKAYDLLRQIDAVMGQVRQWQKEVQDLGAAIVELEEKSKPEEDNAAP